jgi:uncharacterized protein YndB with AHSA1/START domain
VDPYGKLIEPTTLQIQRLLPGPIERVWAYLTESDLRRQWLAAGEMEMRAGGTVDLTWRNDELTDPPGQRPEGFPAEHHKQCQILACDPPHKLAFTFGDSGDVTFELEPRGKRVLLTLTHRRTPDRKTRMMVGAGWHMHLDLLVARIDGRQTEPFWDGWLRLRQEYDQRLPA